MPMTLTDAELTVFSSRVIASYSIGDLYGTDCMIHFGPEDGENMNVPTYIIPDDAGNFADGQSHLGRTAQIVGSDIPVYDPIKSFNDVPRQKVKTRPGLRLLENLGQVHGQAVAKTKTEQLTAFLAQVAEDNDNIVEVDLSTMSKRTEEIDRGLEEIQARFDDAEVPPTDRFARVNTTVWYTLPRIPHYWSKDFGGVAKIQGYGADEDVHLYNFRIRQCPVAFGVDYSDQSMDDRDFPEIARHDMTDVLGVFWHKNAWAMRTEEGLLSEFPFVTEQRSYLPLAQIHIGYKNIDPLKDAIFVLKKKAASSDG